MPHLIVLHVYHIHFPLDRRANWHTKLQFNSACLIFIHSFIHTYTTFCPHFTLPMALFSSIDFFLSLSLTIVRNMFCTPLIVLTLYFLCFIFPYHYQTYLPYYSSVSSIRSNILKICFKCRFTDCYQIEPRHNQNHNRITTHFHILIRNCLQKFNCFL